MAMVHRDLRIGDNAEGSQPANGGGIMITTADLTEYGPIISAVEQFLDSLPVDAVLLRRDHEIVAGNESAAEKGLVQGVKCYWGWLKIDKPCPWCHAKKALSSGRVIDHMVRAKANENGELVLVDEGGIIMDAHWYPIASDLYVHFVGICHLEPERREKTYRDIETFLGKLTPEGPTGSAESIQSIEDAALEQAKCSAQ
jgi:hypothetical protein